MESNIKTSLFDRYIEKNGIPQSLSVDHGSVLSVNTNNKGRDKSTQFELACNEFGTLVIHAGSPKAKGRIDLMERIRTNSSKNFAWQRSRRSARQIRLSIMCICQHKTAYARPKDHVESMNSPMERYGCFFVDSD